MKGTKKPNVYVGALVCTTGAWVLFIGTVAIVQTKKKKKNSISQMRIVVVLLLFI